MLDHSSIIFWTIAYLLVIYNSIKYRNEKKMLLPRLAGCLNLSWELNAQRVSGLFYGHILWLTLNSVIFVLNVRSICDKWERFRYCGALVVFYFVMQMFFKIEGGMLVSSFILDFIVALEYAVFCKNFSSRGKIWVGLCRTIGDVSAWFFYMKDSCVVAIIGGAVLLLNLFYLAYCMEESCQKKARWKEIAYGSIERLVVAKQPLYCVGSCYRI